ATTTTAAATTTTAAATTTTAAATTTTAASVGDLSRCPNPLVLQTDWFPEPEHGALFELTGGQGSIDPDNGHFQGPLAVDPSLTIEIRAGGPYVGFQPASTLMYADDDVFLGYVTTDEQIAIFDSTPTLAVAAPLEKNPQILMWDPDTYDFGSFSDIGASGAVVNVFAGGFFIDYLSGTGQIGEDQFDGSYDGSPTRFITEQGAIVQQGFATNEPYAYEHIFTDWGKPVDFLMIHDSGFEVYSQQLTIRPDKLDDDARECLKAFIPVVQQAQIDFINAPEVTNAVILKAVEDLASFWVLDPGGVVDSVEKMKALGIVSNGPDDTLGNFDLARIQKVIDQVRDIPSFNVTTVTAEDLATNEFIDPSIGL
ncbi:MAG: ABC transporter substrate-binding protein, partial [Acidimicrobiia bacterium]